MHHSSIEGNLFGKRPEEYRGFANKCTDIALRCAAFTRAFGAARFLLVGLDMKYQGSKRTRMRIFPQLARHEWVINRAFVHSILYRNQHVLDQCTGIAARFPASTVTASIVVAPHHDDAHLDDKIIDN